MTRDEARAYFDECGLHYADVTLKDLEYLRILLDEQIILEIKRRAQSHCKPQYWIRTNGIKHTFTQEGRLICAFITGMGEYFMDREVISFNRDGFIGFCGDSDNKNKEPILAAFIEWCDWMKKKKEEATKC